VVISLLFCAVICSWLPSENFSYLSRAQRDSCQSDLRHTENTAKWQEIPLWTTPSSTEDAFKTRPVT